jgi:adenylate kinase
MSSASDELAYLKSLVGQLNDKINQLEAKAVPKPSTPAKQLRAILIGPPGAGAYAMGLPHTFPPPPPPLV